VAADVECAADAQWALECEIRPGEVATEGPFAEVTGLYARVAQRPVVRVTAVHHRANPIFHTILSGREVWNSVGLLGEANVLATVSRQVPGVTDVYFAHGGAGFYEAVVSIDQRRPGMAKQAILATFAAFPPLKIVKAVDDDVDIRDAEDVNWAMAQRMDAATGVLTVPNVAGHELNPTFRGGTGTKIGFDATRPVPHESAHDRIRYAEVDLAGYALSRRRGGPARIVAQPRPGRDAQPAR
jgi:2,5-furandicarboxylate decarboxylase 1